jgi:hypothetical protein
LYTNTEGKIVPIFILHCPEKYQVMRYRTAFASCSYIMSVLIYVHILVWEGKLHIAGNLWGGGGIEWERVGL